jgi:hypothetical protein
MRPVRLRLALTLTQQLQIAVLRAHKFASVVSGRVHLNLHNMTISEIADLSLRIVNRVAQSV